MVSFSPCSAMHGLDCIISEGLQIRFVKSKETAHFYTHLRSTILAPAHIMSHIMHFHLPIDDCSSLPFLPKLHSTVCHVEQSKILELTHPLLRTWVVSGHVQWQTEGLGKDGEKRMACFSVSCCCHMLGIPVGWQLSWSLDGWKHAVLLLYDCAFEAMSFFNKPLKVHTCWI